MLKPWQEFVTHRLVLKKVGISSGSGGHVAKWIKPDVPVDDRFRVDFQISKDPLRSCF